MPERVAIEIHPGTVVSGIANVPSEAKSCFVFAHGAGAGMEHPFMEAFAKGLEGHCVATLRYQFPYMEKRSRRPDRPELCHRTVRSAVAAANQLMGGVPLLAGGKSFGGRMTSQAQAFSPLPNVRALCFLGFPLHPPNAPSAIRADHLGAIKIPMLFVQGTRDAMCEGALLDDVLAKLESVTLQRVQHADHGFHVPARTGQTDAQVMQHVVQNAASWMVELIHNAAPVPTLRISP